MNNQDNAVELGNLLASTVTSVLAAQDLMDRHAAGRVRAYETAELGTLTLPPLWYSFTDVSLEVALSTQVRQVRDPLTGKDETRLYSQLLDPAAVGLYGYEAASSLRVQIRMAPQGLVPLKNTAAAIPSTPPADT